MIHVLRDCKIATNVWVRLIPRQSATRFFQVGLLEWLGSNMTRDIRMRVEGVEGRVMFVQYAGHFVR